MASGIGSARSAAASPAPAAVGTAATRNPNVREFVNGIPVGTKITMANWKQYKAFMPDGMIELFKGTNFWKMPADVEMDVGPTRIFPLPAGYPEATEKYGGQTQMIKLPNGQYDMKNYIAGQPFPIPPANDPDRGWKLLAYSWYGPVPRIAAGTPETGLASLCALDRYGSTNCLKTAYVYRMLDH